MGLKTTFRQTRMGLLILDERARAVRQGWEGA